MKGAAAGTNGKSVRPDFYIEGRGLYEVKGGYVSGADALAQARNYAQLGRKLGVPVYYKFYVEPSEAFLTYITDRLGIGVL